ncbi:MAG TPA: M20/M25/M40 family metallo-hydrolase [Kofleriaceae bacterium]|nr:M20/M25/M40 family metallo-hydrolase [Kofleriaceae bacterium]
MGAPAPRSSSARAAVVAALALAGAVGVAGGAGCKDAPTVSRSPAAPSRPAADPVDPPAPASAPASAAATAPASPGTAVPGARVTWFPPTAEIGAHVAFLADPALRGRGSGTPDEAAAADKIAAWFREAGLEPAGPGGGYLAPFTAGDVHSQNVVGVIRGSDPGAGHVIIGAHLDHLGVIGGAIYPGADDNASGVAGLCAIAAALAHAGQRPRPTVVVVAFGAEEVGLLGSQAYVDAPVLPLDRAIVMINLDMIGRARFLSGELYALAHTIVPDDAIGILTSEGADDLVARARAAARTVHRPLVSADDFGPLERVVRPQIETRGDQASFSAAGVRYLWLSTSMHDDYHRPTDTADKVDPATIAAVGRIVVELVLALPDALPDALPAALPDAPPTATVRAPTAPP